MTRATLVAVSAIRDLLDVLIVGQVPGLNWLLNAPVIFLHYRFAGPRSLVTLVENFPLVEAFPSFTAMALAYPHPGSSAAIEKQPIDGTGGKELV